jgi:hypothetical protein
MIVFHPSHDPALPFTEMRDLMIRRLSKHITDTPPRFIWYGNLGKRYAGWAREDGFEILNITSMIAFKPVIRGQFVEGCEGLEVHLTTRVPGFAQVFVGFWYVLAGYKIYESISKGLAGTEPMAMVSIPVGIVLMGTIMTRFAVIQAAEEETTELWEILQDK